MIKELIYFIVPIANQYIINTIGKGSKGKTRVSE